MKEKKKSGKENCRINVAPKNAQLSCKISVLVRDGKITKAERALGGMKC